MKKWICAVTILLMLSANALADGVWQCGVCGREGIETRFCGSCGSPAPWVVTDAPPIYPDSGEWNDDVCGGGEEQEVLSFSEGALVIYSGVVVGWEEDAKGVLIPYGVHAIGPSAFTSKALVELELPDTVREIGEWAFGVCCDLKRVTLHEGIVSIGDNAFCDCYELEEIEIPEGVVSLGENAFSMCWELRRVVLPASLTEIGRDAFQYCDQVMVYCPAGSVAERYCRDNGVPVTLLK